MNGNSILYLKKWQDKLKKEFNDFCKELKKEINKEDEKMRHILKRPKGEDITTEREELAFLKKTLETSVKAYRELNSSLGALIEAIENQREIRSTDFDNIGNYILKFQSQSNNMNINCLFETKLEQFFLNIKSILFTIINFITNKGYANHIVTEHNVILLDGPDHYSTPMRTLPDRPKNSLFFSKKISQELCKIRSKLVHIIETKIQASP